LEFKSFVSGAFTGAYLRYFFVLFAMISILFYWAKCFDLLTSVANPSMYFMDILVRIFFVEYFDVTRIAFATSSDSLVRVSINAVLVQVIFTQLSQVPRLILELCI